MNFLSSERNQLINCKSFAAAKKLVTEQFRVIFAMLVLACVLFVAAGYDAPVQAAMQSDISDGILAEKVTPSEFKAGDRLLIVCEASDMVLCNKAVPNNTTRLTSGRVETGNTATREVLTAIPGNAAVFQLSEAEKGFYLQCDAGYLTSSATGNALYYAQEAEEGSQWQFKEDAFLYNPSAVSTNGSYTYRNYYLEFFSSYFTVYGKRASSSANNFAMSFYRMGNSLPEEPLLQESYYYLSVYDTSDVHGYLANVTENGEVQYLMAYISDRVNAARGGRKDKVVLLDGGDIYQGTTMSNMTKGHSLSAAYALMDYDAVTVGNHEFDWGLENTVDSDGTMLDYNLGNEWQGVNDTPVIISNLYQNGSKVPWGRDYIILEKTAADANGNELPVKIGVIGLAGEYGSSILTKEFGDKGYSIRLDLNEASALAGQLESSGMCDATILLVHESAGTIANGLTAQAFQDFESYVNDLRVNFNEVAGAVAAPEAHNPILRYDKCWNNSFNFETQGYYLRQAYRSSIAYQLTRAFSLLEICGNIFDPGTSGDPYALYGNYVMAMDALANMPAGQRPEDINRSAAGTEGNGQFRVYCPTFNCDITGLSLQHRIAANEVPDEQLEEFAARLHGRSLEEEFRLAGLWGNGTTGEWTLASGGEQLSYPGSRLLWDGRMYDGTWSSPASRSNYWESGHGIGFNGRWQGQDFVADILDPDGNLRHEVVTCRKDDDQNLAEITASFDMPPEMGSVIYVPYLHFTMEPHVE